MKAALIYILEKSRPMGRHRLRFQLEFSMGYEESNPRSKNNVEDVPKGSC